ncbi:MAG: hydantoinase/oxoprolinase family protein [Acidisphaera sp.]|nr:hydantoinase/oxoprolinase family protein [Acidisphaera sp.]
MAASRIRIGVDVGGTFTDFVLVDDHRQLIYLGKQLTTPRDPSRAIIEGIQRILREAGVDIGKLDGVVHGTTLVTNTVIERKGAKVGLVTTKGFRDVLEMGREIRYDLYDLFLEKPEPLVPRHLRSEVDERVDATGAVLRPLDKDELRTVARRLVDQGVEAIAIAFLHAWRNDAHEREALAIVRAEHPDLPVTLGSEIAPEIREYERSNTAAANAYVQPLMQRYLSRLEGELHELGHRGTLSIMLSAGGLTTVRTASKFPIQLIESGPAAGATAAALYAKLTGNDYLISLDMGGTTAKMCLVEHGAPEHSNEFEAGRVKRFRKGSGLPLKVPVIDLIEIGAGGGSTAWIDGMGLLKVGPESAGSEPGPVCYRRGGTEPAVTDADLLLGYLSPDFFLGGDMALDLDAVRKAVETRIAAPLGLGVEQAAAGIHAVVNENMAAATRMYIAEKGRDPRRYTMIAFGGAGPVHAYGLAKLLKLRRLICPLGAGVTSALGFLVAAPAVDLVRSYVARLEVADWAQVDGFFTDMEATAVERLVEAGARKEEIRFERRAEMRHVGQGFEITVPLPDGPLRASSLDQVRAQFFETYEKLFGRRIEGIGIEALTWRLHAAAPQSDVTLRFAGQKADTGQRIKGERQVFFPETGYAPCPVYNRYALKPGDGFRGPAVVEERESTTIVGPDSTVHVDRFLNLVIDIDQSTVAVADTEVHHAHNG